MDKVAEGVIKSDDFVSLAEVLDLSTINPLILRADTLFRVYRKFYIGDRDDFRQAAITAAIEFAATAPNPKTMSLTKLLDAVTIALKRECKQLQRITPELFKKTEEPDFDLEVIFDLASRIKSNSDDEDAIELRQRFRKLLTMMLSPEKAKLLTAIYFDGICREDIARELYGEFAEKAGDVLRRRELEALETLNSKSTRLGSILDHFDKITLP